MFSREHQGYGQVTDKEISMGTGSLVPVIRPAMTGERMRPLIKPQPSGARVPARAKSCGLVGVELPSRL